MTKLFFILTLLMFLIGCDSPIPIAQAQEPLHTNDTQTELIYGPINSEFTPIMLLVSSLCLRAGEVNLDCLKGSLEVAGSKQGGLTYDALIEASKEY